MKTAKFSKNITSRFRFAHFLDTLLRDTGLCSVKELESCMLDRKVWHSFGSVDTRYECLAKWMNDTKCILIKTTAEH